MAALAAPLAGQAADEKPVAPGTAAMAKRLADLAAAVDPKTHAFLNQARLAQIVEEMKVAPREQLRQLEVSRAVQLLNCGRTEEAVAALDALRESLKAATSPGARNTLAELDSLAAIGWLRLGEQENCLARHGPDSCIVPFSAAARHLEKRGAEHAFAALSRILDAKPDDTGARWLLNVAAMALGTWPDGVPESRRIAPAVFESQAALPRFTDVAGKAGLAAEGLAGGVVTEDFDRDGLLDVMASSWGTRDPLRVWRNLGDGTFEERTGSSGLAGIVSGLNLVSGDFDNDGFVDVIVPRGAWLRGNGQLPKSLLRNRGDFTFEDVTFAAGIKAEAPTQSIAVADYDLDGWLDFFVGNESTGPKTHWPCELWLNRRDGTFANVANAAGVELEAFVKGATATDCDGDGRPDLFLSIMGHPNALLRNVAPPAGAPAGTPPRFEDVSQRAGIGGPIRSFGCASLDWDNDGDDDLFCASYVDLTQRQADDVGRMLLGLPTEAESSALYRNRGDGTYEEIGATIGLRTILLTMGFNFGDLDNDGWLDFVFGNGDPDYRTLLPNRALKNDRGQRFLDVTTAGGFGHLQKGHGVAFADFDDDGDQDVYEVLGGAYEGDVFRRILLENPGNANHWLTIELVGKRSNRAGIGTWIAVHVATPSGPRTIRVTGGSGGSFGASSLQQEIGLGDATAIESLELWWPASNTRQKFEGVAMDQKIRIAEDATTPEPVATKRFTFPR